MNSFEDSILRVMKGDTVVGAGFLVSDRLVATCAHVVISAGAEVGKKISLRSSDDKNVDSIVEPELWRDPNAEDISILRLNEPIKDIQPVILGSSSGTKGHKFSTFGFPVQGQELSGSGEIIGQATIDGIKVLQLRSPEVTSGFSGAPVWDLEQQCVVGMISSIATPDAYGRMGEVAFAVTVETLLAMKPELLRKSSFKGDPLPVLFSTAPTPSPRFTGRKKELSELKDFVLHGHAQPCIVALVGMGGVGKTALAAQFVADFKIEFPGGCYWADLGAYHGNPIPILGGWIQLGGLSSTNFSGDLVNAARSLMSVLQEKCGKAIYVMDDVRAEWLDGVKLLKSVLPSQATLILTTRDVESALVADARIYPLNELLPEDALTLLIKDQNLSVGDERITDFERLSRRMGYLPLALELASKTIQRFINKPGWSVRTLWKQMDAMGISNAVTLKEQNINEAFRLTYNGLTQEQAQLFRLLGVFRSSFVILGWVSALWLWIRSDEREREAIHRKNLSKESLRVGEDWQDHIEKILDSLVAVSLLQWAPGGYRLHPLVWEYAQDELKKETELTMASLAHSEIILSWIHTHPEYSSLDLSFADVVAGMDNAMHRKDWDAVQTYMWKLGPDGGFMVARGYWKELKTRLIDAIQAAQEANVVNNKLAFQINLGIVLERLGEKKEAKVTLERAVSECIEHADDYLLAHAYHNLGLHEQRHNHTGAAIAYYAKSLKLKAQIGDRRGFANSLAQLGTLAQSAKNYKKAEAFLTQSLVEFRVLGNIRGNAAIHHQLGSVALAQKHYETAGREYQASLELWKEVKDLRGQAAVHHQLGKTFQLFGQFEHARQEYEMSCRLKQDTGDLYGLALTKSNLGALEYIDGNFAEAIQHCQEAIQILELSGDKKSQAETYYQLGLSAKALKDFSLSRNAFDIGRNIFLELDDNKNAERLARELRKLVH